MNQVKMNADGTIGSWIGPKATDAYMVVVLRQAILFWLKTEAIWIKDLTPIRMARAAEAFTGKRYQPHKISLGTAYTDLKVHLDKLKQDIDLIDHEGNVISGARNHTRREST